MPYLVRLAIAEADPGSQWPWEALSDLLVRGLFQQFSGCLEVWLSRTTTRLPGTFLQHPRLAEAAGSLDESTRQKLRRVLRSGSVGNIELSLELLETNEAEVVGTNGSASSQNEARQRLRQSRSAGRSPAAGFSYQALVGLHALMTKAEQWIEFESVDDIEIDGTQLVQAKQRSRNLSSSEVVDELVRFVDAYESGFKRFTLVSDAQLAQTPQRLIHKLLEQKPTYSADCIVPDELQPLAKKLSQVGKNPADWIPRLSRSVCVETSATESALRNALVVNLSGRMQVSADRVEPVLQALLGQASELQGRAGRFCLADAISVMDQWRHRLGTPTELEQVGLRLLSFEGHDRSESAEAFLQGLAVSPAHIAAGHDVRRGQSLVDVDSALQSRFCLILSPSGSGKTTLALRHAFERQKAGTVVLEWLGEEHTNAAQFSQRLREFATGCESLLILADDIARISTLDWSLYVREILDIPGLSVLATSRVDEWNGSEFARHLGMGPTTVDLPLDQATAASVFTELCNRDMELHFDDWREPLQQSGQLMMEFVHLLTQGSRIRDVLSEQISTVYGQHTNARQVLAVIALLDVYGLGTNLESLVRITGLNAHDVDSIVRMLVDEQLVWHRGTKISGLNAIRSAAITDLLHEHVPLGVTARLVVDELEPRVLPQFLARFAEDHADEALPLLISAVTEDSTGNLSAIIQAAEVATQRIYARRIQSILAKSQWPRSMWELTAYYLCPESPVSLSELDLLDHVRRFANGLPKSDRPFDSALLPAVVQSICEEMSSTEALDESAVSALNWLRHIDSPSVRTIVGKVSEGFKLPEDPVEAGMALTVLREVDLDLAERLAEQADERSILESSNVEILYWDLQDEAVQVVFSASHDDDERAVIDACLRVARAALARWPSAEVCITLPQLSPGSVHTSGERRLRRDVLPDDVTLTRNVAFLSAFREFSGGRTLFGAIRRYQQVCDEARPSLIELAKELSEDRKDRARISRATSRLRRIWQQGQEVLPAPAIEASDPGMPARAHPMSQAFAEWMNWGQRTLDDVLSFISGDSFTPVMRVRSWNALKACVEFYTHSWHESNLDDLLRSAIRDSRALASIHAYIAIQVAGCAIAHEHRRRAKVSDDLLGNAIGGHLDEAACRESIVRWLQSLRSGCEFELGNPPFGGSPAEHALSDWHEHQRCCRQDKISTVLCNMREQGAIDAYVVGRFGDTGDQYFDVFFLHRVGDFLEAAELRKKLGERVVTATDEDVLRLTYAMSTSGGFCVPYFSFTTRGIVRGDPGSDTIPKDWMPTHPWSGVLYDPESTEGAATDLVLEAAKVLGVKIEPIREQAMLCACLSTTMDIFRKQWFEVAEVINRGAFTEELVLRRAAGLLESLESAEKSVEALDLSGMSEAIVAAASMVLESEARVLRSTINQGSEYSDSDDEELRSLFLTAQDDFLNAVYFDRAPRGASRQSLSHAQAEFSGAVEDARRLLQVD